MADNKTFAQQISLEMNLQTSQTAAVLELLSGGATIPFIARYRKEKTGGLDEVQIRDIEERNTYLTELEERRTAILTAIESQGKLTPELKQQIESAMVKSTLEDLYLPYKPKRRTRATIAREKGLEPLATRILAQPNDGDPRSDAQNFVDAEKGVESIDDALEGANDIVAEIISENANAREFLRDFMVSTGEMISKVVDDKKDERSKFEQYYDYHEAVSAFRGHRFLAIRRGEKEGFLRSEIAVDEDTAVAKILAIMNCRPGTPYAEALSEAARDAFERLLASSIESDVRVDLKQTADREAVDVFAQNVENLLLASPLGAESVIGIDPGIRTGCKVAAVDKTGKYLDNTVIFPQTGNGKDAESKLLAFLAKYPSRAIAIGNGTAGRETEAFVRQLVASMPDNVRPYVVMVSESGASIYSASDLARDEFPDLDLTVRGAISIARRLQDPLAELVKVDPKSIGVGQYQHDVNQPMLKRKLEEVVESCVNRVGVDLNTASAELLKYVAGIGPTMAKKIVAHRELNGKFQTRAQLLKVSGLGPKTYEQAAGFLRVRESENPLDASAVHPERYALVEKMAADYGVAVADLVGNAALVAKLNVEKYVSDDVGIMTLNDIKAELLKPGRDPRAKFEPPKFNKDVSTIEDLKVGMVLDGIVTNVTNFGAFVDIGVHQDGLVHISALSDQYVSNPADVVTTGQAVKVVVMDVDLVRKRISLSCRTADFGTQHAPKTDKNAPQTRQDRSSKKRNEKTLHEAFTNNPFASLKKS